jgi:hypothetical protein
MFIKNFAEGRSAAGWLLIGITVSPRVFCVLCWFEEGGGRRKASFVEVDRIAYVARCTTVAIAVVSTEVP